MRNVFTGLCLFGLFSSPVSAFSLPEGVSTELKLAHIPQSSVAVVVQEVNGDAPLISLNADKPMNPASTMKLLTTYAALDALGPAYRWKTEAYLNGKLENGILQGDLVFKGYGDPKLTVEQFWMWLRELRQRGLREIRGDIVLDHSYFEAVSQDPAEFDNDPTRAYNVGTNALLLNFNALHLHLIPNGHATTALLEPGLDGYTLINRITTSNKSYCGGENAYKAHLDGHNIVLDGSIPATCGEADDYFSLLPQNEYFYAVFSSLWKELGGTLQGRLRAGTAPVDQQPFAAYLSPPLSEVIRDINKFSNNIMARQLFLALGTAPLARNEAYSSRRANVSLALVKGKSDISTPQEFNEATLFAEQAGGDTTDTGLPPGSSVGQTGNIDAGLSLAGSGVSAAPITGALGDAAVNIAPANIEHSISAMQHWLKIQQLQFPELVLENGAGLSRKERISALHLAELLQRATDSPYYAELEASLPILGMDGTVKKRLKDSGSAGYAHLKTGSLEGVKSLAGYVKAHSGKEWIVVFIVNHPNAALAQPAQDALIAWLQTEH